MGVILLTTRCDGNITIVFIVKLNFFSILKGKKRKTKNGEAYSYSICPSVKNAVVKEERES